MPASNRTTRMAPADTSAAPESLEAYERRLPEILAVDDDDLVTINVDVGAAVTTVIGCVPKISAYRDQIAALAYLDQKAIESLRDYAMATSCANAIYDSALAPRHDIAAMTKQAMHLRDVLKADAIALTTRGLIDRARIANFKGGPGYRSIAFELMDYAALLRGVWNQIDGKTALTKSEIDTAWKLAEQIMVAIGRRRQMPQIVAEATEIRAKAVTLFFSAYAEARRAIQFLRFHEGDAEAIAPSLYAGRGGQKPAAAKDTAARRPAESRPSSGESN